MHIHVAAGSTELGELLPHIRSQGAIDLEYESDGEYHVFVTMNTT